jgi:hypothetical protein
VSPVQHVSPVQLLSIKEPVHKEFWLTVVYTYMDINENSPLTCEFYIFLKYNYTYLTSMSEIVSTHNIGTYYVPIYTKNFPPLKITLTCKLVQHLGEFRQLQVCLLLWQFQCRVKPLGAAPKAEDWGLVNLGMSRPRTLPGVKTIAVFKNKKPLPCYPTVTRCVPSWWISFWYPPGITVNFIKIKINRSILKTKCPSPKRKVPPLSRGVITLSNN